MLVAILSDIHGNSEALRRVLDDARKLGINHLLSLGDQIGYYYDAVGVYDLLDHWSKDIIRGNHENMLLELIDSTLSFDDVKKKYGSAHEIALKTLSIERVAFIRSHKKTESLHFKGKNLLMGHGSPWDTDEYIYPDVSQDMLDKCDSKDFDFVFLGHTHYPFIYKGKHSMIINPGSVGQSRVCGGIADWGVLNLNNGVYMAKHTSYDTRALRDQVEKTDPDVPYLRDILVRNASE